MGGDAFGGNSNLKPSRIPKAEYESSVQLMNHTLVSIIDITNIRITMNSIDKPDFGDIDVIILSTDIQEILNILQPDESQRKKSDIYHILFHGRQVDIHFVPTYSLLEYNFIINSFSIVTVIFGKMLYPHNMKLTKTGLYYSFKVGDKKFDLHLTDDIHLIFRWLSNPDNALTVGEFIGLQYRETELVSFFCARSRFYSSNIFNRLDDVDSKELPKQKEKLKYIIEYSKRNDTEKLPKMEASDILPFFNKMEEYELIVLEETTKMKKLKLFSERFNGTIIGQLTGFKGKELGDCMKRFPYKTDEFMDIVLSLDVNAVNDYIKTYI